MGMTFEQFEYRLSELRDKCIKYIKDGCCKYTDCRKCDYQNVCEECEVENGNDDNQRLQNAT